MAEKQQGFVEKLLLDVGVDEKTSATWLNLARTVDSTGSAIMNVVENHEELSKVSQPFLKSAETSFGNLTKLTSQLSERLKSVTSNFSVLNAAQQTGGAVVDVLNFKFKEAGNMVTRWAELWKTGGLTTIGTMAVGFKLVTGAIELSLDAWYKTGQAMADQVKTQEKVAESAARLTGQVVQLAHRTEALAEIRVFRQAGRDLGAAGQAAVATSRAMSMMTLAVQASAVRFGVLVTKIPEVGGLLNWLRVTADGATEAIAEFLGQASSASFKATAFETASAALARASANMQEWSAETGIAEAEISGMLERMSRRMGDVSGAYSAFTVAMNKSFRMSHVNARELVALMEGVSAGAELSTDSLRVFGAELETNSKRFADAGIRLRFVVDKMMEGQDLIERETMFKKLTESAVIAYGLMEQTLNNYANAQMTLDKRVWNEYDRISKLKARTFEEEVRYLQLVQRLTTQQLENEERLIGALESRMNLQKQGGRGTSFMEEIAPDFARLQGMMARTSEVFQKQGAESAKQYLAETNNFASQLIEKTRAASAQAFNYVAQNAEKLASLKVTFLAPNMENRIAAFSKALLTARAAAFDATKKEIALEADRFNRMAQADSARLASAEKLQNQISAAYSTAVAYLEEYQSMASDARRSVLEIYSVEGSLIRTNFQARMQFLDEEIKRAKALADTNAGDAQRQMQSLMARKNALIEQISLQRELMNATAPGVTQAKLDPGELGKQRAFGANFEAVLKEAMTGSLSQHSRSILENMGPGMQKMINDALAIGQSKDTGKMITTLEKIASSSASFEEFATTTFRTFGKSQANVAMEIAKDRGMTQPFLDRAGGAAMGLTRPKSPQEELREVAQQLTALEKSNAERAAAEAQNARELQTKYEGIITTMDHQLKAAQKGGQDLATVLERLILDLSEVFGGMFSPTVEAFISVVKSDLKLSDDSFASSTKLMSKAVDTFSTAVKAMPDILTSSEEVSPAVDEQVEGYLNKQIEAFRRASADGDVSEARFALKAMSPEAIAESLGVKLSVPLEKAIVKQMERLQDQNQQLLRSFEEAEKARRLALNPMERAARVPLGDESLEDTKKRLMMEASIEAGPADRVARAAQEAAILNKVFESTSNRLLGVGTGDMRDPQMDEQNNLLKQLIDVTAQNKGGGSDLKDYARIAKDQANKKNPGPGSSPTVLRKVGGLTPAA
jgi:hypothetical protein